MVPSRSLGFRQPRRSGTRTVFILTRDASAGDAVPASLPENSRNFCCFPPILVIVGQCVVVLGAEFCGNF